jgi:hypothetical protein
VALFGYTSDTKTAAIPYCKRSIKQVESERLRERTKLNCNKCRWIQLQELQLGGMGDQRGNDVYKRKAWYARVRPYGELLKHPYEIPHTNKRWDAGEANSNPLPKKQGWLWRRRAPIASGSRSLRTKVSCSVINPLVRRVCGKEYPKGQDGQARCPKIANYGIDNCINLVDFQASSRHMRSLRYGSAICHFIQIKTRASGVTASGSNYAGD